MEQTAINEKQWALIAHLGSLAGYIIPFGNIIVPLVVYVSKKDESEFVREHARESLNFQITFTILMVFAVITIILMVGILFLIILPIINLIFVVLAAMAIEKGDFYKYPLAVKFI
ncbi:DUF4870 domain-containing protein [Fulvivirga sp. M361]|uniref:DUF4870 domain-containing protein n=1 Tax=Fulvivirga sp. M361 TaxID=2594266 RepID=UPI001179D4EC|nr:DUF4870 domain-containing protein [Fulvivirga sp. M361]TRX51613.1 DUF4870 domain-containing protein [Fulvivirga sp. M361]